MSELTAKKQQIPEHLKKHAWKKGQSGNEEGRPVGTISLLSKLKKEFRENPEKLEEFMERYMNNPANEKHIVEMVDGKPRQNIGLDGGEEGLAINFAQVFNKEE